MKQGTLVYVPKLDRYGFVNEVNDRGRILTIKSINPITRQIDILAVYDLIVEAVGLVKRLIVIFKLMFPRKVKA